jgi:DNA-binding PadR family transcriptional regulator
MRPTSSYSGPSGRRGAYTPWSALEDLRAEFAGHAGRAAAHMTSRAGRGDVRSAVLLLLHEQPMHGYQIIREIESRSEGSWKPSPGSVYPTLQMLADEGLVVVEESGGRKTYSLTEEGEVEATKAAEEPAPWESEDEQSGLPHGALPRAGVKLGQAISQVATTGTTAQVEKAVDVVDDARRRLFAILAEE